MSRFIRKVTTGSGATAVQVVSKRGRVVEGIEHVGSAHSQSELDILLASAQKIKDAGQMRLEFFEEDELGDNIFAEASYSKLLYDTLSNVYDSLGFNEINDKVFKQLVLARIIEPASKRDTIRILDELGLKAPSNSTIHRALRRTFERGYREILSSACLSAARPNALALILYDVTTLYFEIQKEDEYRISGLSKERRLEPQITLGLLCDSSGFPLFISSFEGNKAECKTFVPVLEAFCAQNGLTDITVTADAAMLSASNLSALEEIGYHYIISSRIAKTPYEIAEYQNESDRELRDGQIIEGVAHMTINHKRVKRRVIYQFRVKRQHLDLLNIEKAVNKAERMIAGKSAFKRNRFLKIGASSKTLNEPLVEENKRKAGIKGYVTDLESDAQFVIDAYHQLFEVESTFRMAKSDLNARPMFHQKREKIEAHLTVVFAALAISRRIQDVTGLSIKKFVKKLKKLRTVEISINGSIHIIEPRVSGEVENLLKLIAHKCGH